jgi:hypothetical protein
MTFYTYNHGRISALATLTVSPRRQHLGWYLCFQPANFTASHVATFLRGRLHHLRGHVLLLWARGSIHKGPASEEIQRAYPRLQLAEFPAYAPELNPVEQLWNDFRGHTANSLHRDTGPPPPFASQHASRQAVPGETALVHLGFWPALSTMRSFLLLMQKPIS